MCVCVCVCVCVLVSCLLGEVVSLCSAGGVVVDLFCFVLFFSVLFCFVLLLLALLCCHHFQYQPSFTERYRNKIDIPEACCVSL